jgi:hypothetical protein
MRWRATTNIQPLPHRSVAPTLEAELVCVIDPLPTDADEDAAPETAQAPRPVAVAQAFLM